MAAPTHQRRWFHLTPDRLIGGLLPLEGFLFLSERFHWFPFNEKKGWTVLIAVASVGVTGVLMTLWFAASLFFRWRFQFSIRSLLFGVVVVAIPCSWLAVEMKAAERQRQAVEEIEKLGGGVTYDYDHGHFISSNNWIPDAELPGPVWLMKILGDVFFTNVTNVGFRLGEDTDVVLVHCKDLIQLQGLALPGTKVTDAGLVNLKGLNQLQTLDLEDTQVTDAGLEHLKGLTHLQTLYLTYTRVTDDGVKRLQQALPDCRILH